MYFNAYSLPDILRDRIIIILDGEDVTGRCFAADTDEGWCGLYKHRNGVEYVEAGEIAKEERRGAVSIALKPGTDLLAELLRMAEEKHQKETGYGYGVGHAHETLAHVRSRRHGQG